MRKAVEVQGRSAVWVTREDLTPEELEDAERVHSGKSPLHCSEVWLLGCCDGGGAGFHSSFYFIEPITTRTITGWEALRLRIALQQHEIKKRLSLCKKREKQ